jgi:hypothetical protein
MKDPLKKYKALELRRPLKFLYLFIKVDPESRPQLRKSLK